MKPLLSLLGTQALTRLAQCRSLLAFDFDGTLAPIVDQYDRAQMRAVTREHFTRLCELYPCAVISGRSCDDVVARLHGAAVPYVVGSHGAEPSPDLVHFERDVSHTFLLLQQVLTGFPLVEIENKRYSLAIHFREASQPA